MILFGIISYHIISYFILVVASNCSRWNNGHIIEQIKPGNIVIMGENHQQPAVIDFVMAVVKQ